MPDYTNASGDLNPKRLVLGALNFSGTYNGGESRAVWNSCYMLVTNRANEEIREEFEFISDFFHCFQEHGYVCWPSPR